LKYLHENGCPWDENCCEYVSKNGDLEILKYLHENEYPLVRKNCCKYASTMTLNISMKEDVLGMKLLI